MDRRSLVFIKGPSSSHRYVQFPRPAPGEESGQDHEMQVQGEKWFSFIQISKGRRVAAGNGYQDSNARIICETVRGMIYRSNP